MRRFWKWVESSSSPPTSFKRPTRDRNSRAIFESTTATTTVCCSFRRRASWNSFGAELVLE